MKKRLALFLLALSLLVGCSAVSGGSLGASKVIDDKYRNYYEIFVRSFYDSDGNGIGDINGMTQKLDYLNDGKDNKNGLGISGIWLMPIMPSPSYHKYDVTDYYDIDKAYGTLDDFKNFVEESKSRGINVIIDLVLNHSSDQHPWFVSAAKSYVIEPCGEEVCKYDELCREHNKYCGYYTFLDEKGKNFNYLHQVKSDKPYYYLGSFGGHMPDLNLDNEDLRQELKDIGKFWLDIGVAGFRLDAVIWFYEENAQKSNEFLSWFYKEMQGVNPDVYCVGEVWSDANTVAKYYESGIDSFFNFDFALTKGRIANAVRSGQGKGLADNIVKWNEKIKAANPNAIDSPFLTNHDNGRSIGYYMNDPLKMKVAASISLFMPGTPYIYYGDEIGMSGSGIDENKRMPFVWSVNDKTGITNAPPNATAENKVEQGVAEQLADKVSLLNYYREIIKLKNKYPAIARGKVSTLDLGNAALCSYTSEYEGETVYIIHNVSADVVEVSLPEVEGRKYKMEFISPTDEKPVLKGNGLSVTGYSTVVVMVK